MSVATYALGDLKASRCGSSTKCARLPRTRSSFRNTYPNDGSRGGRCFGIVQRLPRQSAGGVNSAIIAHAMNGRGLDELELVDNATGPNGERIRRFRGAKGDDAPSIVGKSLASRPDEGDNREDFGPPCLTRHPTPFPFLNFFLNTTRSPVIHAVRVAD